MSNCLGLDAQGSCTGCKENFVLTGTDRKVCCPTGKYFEPSTGVCTNNPTVITNCSVYATSTLCS